MAPNLAIKVAQGRSKTSQNVVVILPILFALTFCLNAVSCDIFCPPAVENVGYNITSEQYNLTGIDQNIVKVTWYYGQTIFATCNFSSLACNLTGQHTHIHNAFWYRISSFGRNNIQMTAGTNTFVPNLQQDYAVLWHLGPRLIRESCNVAIGSPKNECSPVSPCVNASRCNDLQVGYQCVCTAGYSGKNCFQGDLQLRCAVSKYFITFNQWTNSCPDFENNCYVAGLDYNVGIDLNYLLLSNNGSSVLQVTPSISGKTIHFRVCKIPSSLFGTYQLLYELQSTVSVAPYKLEIIVEANENNNPPVFNTHSNDSPYLINVPEDTRPQGAIIATVYKSKSQSCDANACIQVIDSNVNPYNGINSVTLSVTLENQQTAPIMYTSSNTSESLGYFFLSGQLTPSTIIYSLTATDGSQASAVAKVIFNITDANEPPVCNVNAIYADLDIRSQPDRFIWTVSCIDNDVDATFKKIDYTITGIYASYFRANEIGTIIMYQPVMGLEQGQINFNVTATGYSATPNSSYVFYIPVYINIQVPGPRCNLTVTGVPETWRTGSEADLTLECETWGVDKLKVLSWTNADMFNVSSTNQSPTILKIKVTLKQYTPANIYFEVTVTLGGKNSTATVLLQMYNAPKFNNPSYQTTVPDTFPVGVPFLFISATSDVPGAILSYRIKSGENSSLFTLGNNGSISSASPLQQVGGLVLQLVCEVQDSVSNLATTTTVTIIVSDTNEAPVCSKPGPVMIDSNLAPDSVITTISCSDPDVQLEYRTLSYTILYDSPFVHMEIRSNGDIVLLKNLPAGITFIGVLVNVSDIGLSALVQFNITVNVIKCSSETTQSGLTFPETAVNSEITINCPGMHSGQISRSCYLNTTWGPFNYTNCINKDLEDISSLLANLLANISLLSPEEVSNTLKTVPANLAKGVSNSSTLLPEDIKQIVEIFNKVGTLTTVFQTASLDGDTVKSFGSIADILFGADDDMWEESSKDYEAGATMLDAMDNIATAGLRDDQDVDEAPFVTNHLELTIATSSGDIDFSNNKEASYENDSSPVKQSITSAFLSKKAFEHMQGTIKYSVILYKNVTDKLQINQKLQNGSLIGKVLNSDVLTFMINTTIARLSPPLVMNFTVVQNNYSNPACGYLDTSASLPGVWATAGCTTINLGDKIQCFCDHLTNFAVLMNPYADEVSLEATEILSIISAVGCGISIFCLVITIIVYKCLWKYVKCDRSVLNVNLSVCLILAYITFLVGVDKTDHEIGCKVVAALLHYLFLVVFFIMLSEGIEVFKTLSFVFSAESILCKLISLSYGVPAIIVAVSLGVTKTDGYGSERSCWLSTSGGLIWAFVGPALLVIVLNFIILIQVLRIMQRSKTMMAKSAHERAKSVVRAICILSPFLGITWVFGILSVNQGTIVFQYLFAIFNSLQGLFIFICYCLLTSQVRDGFRALRRKHRARSFDSTQKVVSRSFSGQFTDFKTNSGKSKTNSNSDTNTRTTSERDSTSSDDRKNSAHYKRQDSGGTNDTHPGTKESSWPHTARNGSGRVIPLAYSGSARSGLGFL